MKTIVFRGIEVEYNERLLKSWKFQRRFAAAEGAEQVFMTADELLLGKSDEIAEQLGDDIEVMGELLTAIGSKMAGEAKN